MYCGDDLLVVFTSLKVLKRRAFKKKITQCCTIRRQLSVLTVLGKIAGLKKTTTTTTMMITTTTTTYDVAFHLCITKLTQ